jgi:hypothetical protein
MVKSMKTAFIRVTKVNDTEEGVMTFDQDGIKETLDEWSFSAGIEYWFIDHTPDDDDPNDHFHIVIRFRNPTSFDTVKSKFPYGRIETARNVKRAVQYLVHMNNPEKIQYPWENIITNCPDLTPFKVMSRDQHEVNLQRIFEQIETGELTPFNWHYKIPIDVYSKNKTVINNAFQLSIDRVSCRASRDITVIYYYGKPGIGKTAFAKQYFNSIGCPFAVSSSSNDPWQDYQGQRGFLWDDFRDSQFGFADLLKLLDPNTRSSGKSRYHNKDFVGDLIIMTSNQRMDFLYKKYQADTNDTESMTALRRRIVEYYEFTSDTIKIYMYDKSIDKYSLFREFPNPISKFVDDEPSHVFDSSPFENMGIELSVPASIDHGTTPVNPGSLIDSHSRPVRDLLEEQRKFKELQGCVSSYNQENINRYRKG